jgi:hypothetical protein
MPASIGDIYRQQTLPQSQKSKLKMSDRIIIVVEQRNLGASSANDMHWRCCTTPFGQCNSCKFSFYCIVAACVSIVTRTQEKDLL